MKKHTWSPIAHRYLWGGALIISLVFVLNAWIAFNLGPQDNPFDWFFEATTVATNYFLWALLIPAIYFFIISRDFMWRLSWRMVIAHLLASILIAAIHRYVALGLYVGMTWLVKGYLLDLFGTHSMAWVVRGTIPSFIQYWLIVALLWGFRYYQLKRTQELELIKKDRELANAQFNALKMQLHPHFFFNTLNTISSVMERNVEDAQNIVAKLARLMRSLVDSDKKQYTSLSKEIEYIGDYLHVEQARFEDSLKVDFKIESQASRAEIPNLLLQPLVENSVKHGVANLTAEKHINIEASVKQNSLEISVTDNGVGAANTDYVLANPGVGIKSVRERLHHIYNQDAEMKIESAINQGFKVIVKLPFKVWKH